MYRRSRIRIPYIIISDRPPESNWLPEVLIGKCTHSVTKLPQNIFSLLDPPSSESLVSVAPHVSGYDLTYLFSDSYETIPAFVRLRRPWFTVILFEASETADIEKITSHFDDYVLFSPLEKHHEFAKKTCGSNFCSSTDEVVNELFRRGKYLYSQGLHDEPLLAYFLPKNPVRYPKPEKLKLPAFKPCFGSHLNRAHLTGALWYSELEDTVIEHADRPTALVNAARELDRIQGKASEHIPLILTYPYFHRELTNSYYSAVVAGAAEQFDYCKKSINRALRVEQKTEDYTVELETEDDSKFESSTAGVLINARNLSGLDCLAFYHSSFTYSPVVRCPQKGKTLNLETSAFDPSQFSASTPPKTIITNIKRLGEKLTHSIPNTVADYVSETSRPIVAISDLPIEWMEVNGQPLAHLNDICRLPEHPPRSLMSEFAKNSQFGFSITPETPKKVLVANLSPDDERLTASFNVLTQLDHLSHANFITVQSVDELAGNIKNQTPDFLLLFTHGMARKEQFDSILQLNGSDFLGEDIISNGIAAPIMFVCACDTAPLYGYFNSIIHAFLAAGAVSVLASTLPLSVVRATAMCSRLISNLLEATRNPIHRTWLELTAHTARTSTFDDRANRVLESKYFRKKTIKTKLEPKAQWMIKAIRPWTRREAFSTIDDSIERTFPAKHRKKAREILNLTDYLPESLFYTHWGRPDLVTFENWYEDRWDNYLEKLKSSQ